MHRFLCFPKDGGKTPPNLQGAHLIGTDNVPVRADIRWQDGAIVCGPRSREPVGLSLLWPVNGFGTVQLQTTRLPIREQPYILEIELARHQLMRLSVKREEWGLFDYSGTDEFATQIDRVRDTFIAALQHADQPQKAARLAAESLALGLVAGEMMSHFHADVFLVRRRQGGGFSRPFLGTCLPPALGTPALLQTLAQPFDFVRLPFVWREIQPAETQHQYDGVDACLKACTAAGIAVRGGPLLNFGVSAVPDWMYIWENDFEAIYEAAREHVERTVKRYARQITSWLVVSGLHADNVFGFSFEQVMELTRMAATVTRQSAPRAQVIIDLSQPWGEYYARNQQTVPPLLYADMVVQSGINFDAFGLQFLFGLDTEGFHVRDLFQVSALIDKLANLGKPLHVTAAGVPSSAATRTMPGGEWRGPWTDDRQAEWLAGLIRIALSKPYVESVCLVPLADGADSILPTGGLLHTDQSPKPAIQRIIDLRRQLLAGPDK